MSDLNNHSDKSGTLKKEAMFSLYLIILYLFLEYGRPQLLIPVLRYLHLPAITVALIGLTLLFSGRINVKDKQSVIFILLLVEMVIHGPFAVNNYWAFQVFYTMSITFVAFLAIVNIVDSFSKYKVLVKYWIYIYIFLAIYGYFNANLSLPSNMRYGMGVGGFIGDENDFSMAVNMILPFALFGIFSANGTKGKIYYLLLICLFVFVVIISESRGGFIGLVSVLFYSWMRSNKKAVFAVVLGILALFTVLVAPQSYWDEIGTITTENTQENQYGTGAQRIYAWKLGYMMFRENPVLGVGQGNYPWNVKAMENKLGVQWQERSLSGRAAHSMYFTLLPELGSIGVILFGMLIWYSIKDLIYIRKVVVSKDHQFADEDSKRIYYLTLALEGSLVGYLTSSTFISTLYYPNVWIWLGFSLALKKIVDNRAIGAVTTQRSGGNRDSDSI